MHAHSHPPTIITPLPPRIIPIALSALLFCSCQKKQADGSSNQFPVEIESAHSYFTASVLSSAIPPNAANFRAGLPKTIRWDLATTTQLSCRPAVIAPIQFTGKVYVSSDLTPGRLFDLNTLTRLVLTRDSTNNFHYRMLTYIPDSAAINSQSFTSGILLSEDWQGNSLSAPQRFAKRTLALDNSDNKQTDVIQTIQVCNTINGYNYSPDDPGAGYSWSETSCTTYEFQNPTPGGTIGPGDLGTILTTRPVPLTIDLVAPKTPIANIANYFKCFTPGDAGHNFSVTLAVEQPAQGTRQPWTFTSGGVSGSAQAGNPVNVGHTYLIFSEGYGGQPSTQRSVGFYPQGLVTPFSRSAQGVLGDDEYTDYNISLTISVPSSQFFAILQYVTQGNNSGYMYDLNSNNCTTFALDALDAGGVSIPSTIGFWVGSGQGLDPGDLGEDIRAMQVPGNMSRNTVSNSHPNVGTCN